MVNKTHSQKTIEFFKRIDLKIKNDILANIAEHYSITLDQAYDEVTHEEAESFLDYLTEPIRSKAYSLLKMQDAK